MLDQHSRHAFAGRTGVPVPERGPNREGNLNRSALSGSQRDESLLDDSGRLNQRRRRWRPLDGPEDLRRLTAPRTDTALPPSSFRFAKIRILTTGIRGERGERHASALLWCLDALSADGSREYVAICVPQLIVDATLGGLPFPRGAAAAATWMAVLPVPERSSIPCAKITAHIGRFEGGTIVEHPGCARTRP